jgi:hypothetical protein
MQSPVAVKAGCTDVVSDRVDLPTVRPVIASKLSWELRGVLAAELSGDCFFDALDGLRRIDWRARPRMLMRRAGGLTEGLRLQSANEVSYVHPTRGRSDVRFASEYTVGTFSWLKFL